MSIVERNQMLQNLHHDKVSRDRIKFIMNDLDKSGIFIEPELEYEEDDLIFVLEKESDILFSNLSASEKIKALREIKLKNAEHSQVNFGQNYFYINEIRIQEKQKELIDKGIVHSDYSKQIKTDVFYNRYGRTPLHEAIAAKDIKTIRKYARQGKYLSCKDNNGHTPIEMAYYKKYKEALSILGSYHNKKRVR